MSKTKVLPQKVAEKKTIILNPRLDHYSLRSRGESIKRFLFAGHLSRKNRLKDISLIACNKYYEPYLFIGGRYSVDYCKKHLFAFKVKEPSNSIHFGEKKFRKRSSSSQKLGKAIRIACEEHAHYEKETYIILDKMMKEIPAENFPLAPFESKLENLKDSDFELRKTKISLDSEIAVLRSILVKRPSNASRIIREFFEITNRIVVYRPFYELVFQNNQNGESATGTVDGITGEMVLQKHYPSFPENLKRTLNLTWRLVPSPKTKQSKNAAPPSQAVPIPETMKKNSNDLKQNPILEEYESFLNLRLILGSVSLVVGLLAANFALFGWGVTSGSYQFLGEYARNVCAYGGFGAIVFGSMLLNDFLVLRSHRLRNQARPIAPVTNRSEKEQIHFLVSEFEEEGDLASQTSKRQKC